MTEKQYGGATGRGSGKASVTKSHSPLTKAKEKKQEKSTDSSSGLENLEDYKRAGQVASQVVAYAKSFIKPGMPLLEIADKIDAKILELKAKPAFPVNLSINEIAAHSTPAFNDESRASGLLKVDIGVHINGYVADTAFSLDLENNEENKKLIEASELALKKALETVKTGIKNNEIGAIIDKTIKSLSLQPIHNLSGHSLDQYEVHSGITIPNFDNSQGEVLEEGAYAIEPFATNGLGQVKDGKPSGIYRLEREGAVRDTLAREVLAFIIEEYQTLPFCSRWIQKKFGTRGLLALKRIEEAGLLHHYPQLIEVSGKKVSQAEHTIVLSKDKKIVTTL